jgi:hypothetical protein
MQRGIAINERARRALEHSSWDGDPDTLRKEAQSRAASIVIHMSEPLWKLGTEEGVECGQAAYRENPRAYGLH